MSFLRTLLILGRISNLPTVWTNVAVGWFLCGGGLVAELVWLIGGMSFLYIGGMTLNDAFDAHWDRKHSPGRPIPSGKVSEKAVWLIGILQIIVGFKILMLLTTTHWYWATGLVAAILLYNWLHKKWSGSVLIMGLCRALVYIGAGSAVGVTSAGLMVPGVLFAIAGGVVLYIAGLTLAARNEHLDQPSALSFLPRILLMLPVLFPLIASRTVPDSPKMYGLILTGIIAIWAWVAIIRTSLREKIPKGIAFAIAGIALYDAAAVSFANLPAALGCLACFVLTLIAQRFIPAT